MPAMVLRALPRSPLVMFTRSGFAFGAPERQTRWSCQIPDERDKAGPHAQAIVSTIPPSTRSAAPVVAEACGEQA